MDNTRNSEKTRERTVQNERDKYTPTKSETKRERERDETRRNNIIKRERDTTRKNRRQKKKERYNTEKEGDRPRKKNETEQMNRERARHCQKGTIKTRTHKTTRNRFRT